MAKRVAVKATPTTLQPDAIDTIARAANLTFAAAQKMESLMEPKHLQGLTRRVRISIYDDAGALITRETKDFKAEDNLSFDIEDDQISSVLKKFPNAKA